MRRAGFRISVVLTCVLAVQAATAAELPNTCGLAAPPKDALRLQQPPAPLMFQYPDPSRVPAAYTGCLNTWLENGQKVMEARFDKGRIVHYRMGHDDVACDYRDARVIREVVSDEMRRQVAQLPPEARADMRFCPSSEQLLPARSK